MTYAHESHHLVDGVAWHRALVLEYERALQRHDPSVSAHYWDFTATAPNIFSNSFMGANTPPSGSVIAGPFAGWTIDGMTPIVRRSDHDHTGVPPTQSDATTLAPATFAAFKGMEGNPHGSAHVWAGGWMGSVPTAVRDPVFFLLHSDVERLWCKWQSMGHHGAGASQYDRQGAFVCGVSTDLLGSHLDDTMWPWNGATGAGPCVASSLDDRPASAPGGALLAPAAPGFMLGPPAMPTPRDVIDYLGRSDPVDALGYGYDDVPYN